MAGTISYGWYCVCVRRRVYCGERYDSGAINGSVARLEMIKASRWLGNPSDATRVPQEGTHNGTLMTVLITQHRRVRQQLSHSRQQTPSMLQTKHHRSVTHTRTIQAQTYVHDHVKGLYLGPG